MKSSGAISGVTNTRKDGTITLYTNVNIGWQCMPFFAVLLPYTCLVILTMIGLKIRTINMLLKWMKFCVEDINITICFFSFLVLSLDFIVLCLLWCLISAQESSKKLGKVIDSYVNILDLKGPQRANTAPNYFPVLVPRPDRARL